MIRLFHIRDELAAMGEALEGERRSGGAADHVVQRAVERALLIVSEAAKSLPRDLTARYPEVDWRGVCGLGDVLRHDYQSVDADVIWAIWTDKVPHLEKTVVRMIRDLAPPGG